MKLTTSSPRIPWVGTICLLANISIICQILFPASFGSTVSASLASSFSSSSENPQEIVAQILKNENVNSNHSPLESIWQTFKHLVDSTKQNVLPSSLASSSMDPSSSAQDYDSVVRSQQQTKDDVLNRRGLLMEQSLNEHYMHEIVKHLAKPKEGKAKLPQRKRATPALRNKAPPSQGKDSDNSNPAPLLTPGSLRWRQPNPATGDATCYCFSEKIDSYWSFQWCPRTKKIYQGRRQTDGVLQPMYNLGSGSVTAAEGKENAQSLSDVQGLVATARKAHPFAAAIHPYVGGDVCVKGGSLERASVLLLHDRASQKCRAIEGKEVVVESVDEVKLCQYIVHICMKSHNDSSKTGDEFDDFDDSDNGDESSSLFPKHLTESDADKINKTLHYIKDHITGSFVRKSRADMNGKARENALTSLRSALPPLPQTRIKANLELIKNMFMHAYDSYMYYGFPASEVKPIACAPASFNLVKIPGLTLIDSLDTLVLFGNYTEFARAVERLRMLNDEVDDVFGSGRGLFNINYNVSVFETNIRVLGGLLSAHQLATAFLEGKVHENEVWAEDESVLMGVPCRNSDEGSDCDIHSAMLECKEDTSPKPLRHNRTDALWIYDGFLLDLARDIADRLLPAFNTQTGIPYGTVNLLKGVPKGETPIASLAGGGTLSLEMELLSRLTGDEKYGRAAKLAARALWMRRSVLGILGKHICSRTGQWTESFSGIGSNSDSFYEYLIKHHILFPEDADFWPLMLAVYGGVYNQNRMGEWYGDVEMSIGRQQDGAPRRVLEALMAFYPGMQVLLGEVTPAARTLNSFFLVREHVGFLPERFQFGSWKVVSGGEKHLLRPELLESAYFLHRSSKGFQSQFRSESKNRSVSDSSGWLWSGDFALHTIEKLTRTRCGYASVQSVSPETSGKLNVQKSEVKLEDDMPSYFLSETLKYLYLLFDDNNILHTDEDRDWVFTTEAHPIHHEQKEASVNAKLLQQKEELKSRIQRRLDKRDKQARDIRKGLVDEKWTSISKMEDFVNQLEPLIKNGRNTYKNRRLLESYNSSDVYSSSNAIERLFPQDNSWSPFDVFNERSQMLNPAFLSFRKLGNELELTNSCTNLYASNYLWIRALSGGIADYSDTYRSRATDNFVVSESDSIQLGSVDALALHGTGVHIKSFYDEFFSCPVKVERKTKSKKPNSLKNGERKGELGNGSTRFKMGGGMGSFDISAFPGGSGFYVQHVESGENIVTTLIEEQTSGDRRGPLVLVYSKKDQGNDIHVTKENDVASQNRRAVVLADLSGNSYSCAVQIFEAKSNDEEQDSTCSISESQGIVDEYNQICVRPGTQDEIVHQYPCSPALFGPTHISHLDKVKNIVVEAIIKPADPGDEEGCGQYSMSKASKRGNTKPETPDPESSQAADTRDADNEIISIVQRGECTFQEKSLNKKLTQGARGVIVVNSNKGDDLFVMSGGGREELASLDLEDYPVTVLVTRDDGEKILKLIDAGDNKSGSQTSARISLTHDRVSADVQPTNNSVGTKGKFWPRVTASSEGLQIYSQSGWGIHAVQTEVDDESGDVEKTELQWQLYLLKTQNVDEDVP